MSAPSSILMTADATAGPFACSLELARALARRSVRVVLAVMGGPLSIAQRGEVRAIPELTVHESAYQPEWTEDPWNDVMHAGAWLLELEDRERPAVVHLCGYAHGALPFHAPRVVVAHAPVLSWHLPPEAALDEEAGTVGARWARYRGEVARGIAAADALVAPTRAMLDAVCRDHGAPPRIRVIPDGRDPERHRPAPKEDLVVALGRTESPAEHLVALEAAARQIPWPVVAAGHHVLLEGRHLTAVEVIGDPVADRAAALLGRASIYALPARDEPAGATVLEAALAGCALVLGDLPGLRELWGGAALFVDPGDPEDLTRALQCLISHPALREALAGRSRTRALGLSPERMALGYLALYGELAARPTRPSDRPRSLVPPRDP